jgi:pimeloyl-ACP methyl ester carboxylesterase
MTRLIIAYSTILALVVLGGAALFAGYVAIALLAARWLALRDDAHVETLEIELPTVGHHIALHHHSPAEKRFIEPVIVCHGLAANRFNMDFSNDGKGDDRISLARALARSGFDTWVLELRGRGHATVPRGADWSVDDEVREDLPRAIETVLDLTGAPGVLWVGHSKGGILQYLLHADEHPAAGKVRGLVAIGSPGTFAHQKDMSALVGLGRLFARTGWRVPMTFIAKLGIPIAGPILYIAAKKLPVARSVDAPILRRIMASLAADIAPGVMRQVASWFDNGGTITRLDATPYDESFIRITAPLLLIAGSDDLLAPPDAVRYAYERAGSADKTYVVMGPKSGARSEYGHGDLVVGKHAPDEVFPKVAAWLEAHAQRSLESAPRNLSPMPAQSSLETAPTEALNQPVSSRKPNA